MLGKKANELQAGVHIIGDSITGTLKNVTGYTGFSDQPEDQSGHYLALKFDVLPSEATTTVEIVGGTKGPVELDEDKLWVGKIANKDSQSIKVESKYGDKTVVKTYELTKLTLE